LHWSRPSPAERQRLKAFLEERRVVGLLGLDLQVQDPLLPVLRAAGVQSVIAYWGAPMSGIQTPWTLLAKQVEVRLRANGPDHFIFESEAMRALAVRGRGIAPERTAVIPTGIDVEQFARPEGHGHGYLSRALGVPAGRKVIVYSGHFEARKGVQTLIAATKLLVEQHGRTDFHVLLAGNRGNDAVWLEEMLARSDARRFVTFAGYRHDLPCIFRDAYLGCIPSEGWDSFPMSSLEMQAAGLPVVVSSLQGVPETMVDGATGRVFPAGDARRLAAVLAQVLDDPADRQRMSLAASHRIATAFTRERQVARLASELEQVLRRCARPWSRLDAHGGVLTKPLFGL